MGFKQYLEEAATQIAAENDGSHYTHIEDELYVKGSKGIPKILVSVIELVKGIPTTETQTKIDGSPSAFFGFKDGKFFVATKSIFNADPKVNYTDKDIDENHGHAPGLVEKLKFALKYLPNIVKPSKDVIYQGDVMFTPDDLQIRNIDGVKHYIFKPNTVVNAVPVDSKLGHQIASAKFGFAPHTKYISTGQRQSIPSSELKSSPLVFIMPIEAPKLDDYTVLKTGIDAIRSALEKTDKSGLEFISSSEISPLIMQYANFVVKNNTNQTFAGFRKFIYDKFQKEIDKVKTDASKKNKEASRDALLSKIDSNKAGISSVIETHEKVGKLKDLIIAELDKKQPIKRFFMNGNDLTPTNPEGYVGFHAKYGTSKFVNRTVFSKQNFMAGAMRKPVKEATEKKKIGVVVPLGRFNPPHKDHKNLIDACIKHAKQIGGVPMVYVSLSQDSKKNPLTADQKLYYLKKMYPLQKNLFFKPPANSPSMIGVLKSLDNMFDEIHIILGDDRMDVVSMVNKYNGREYTFDKIIGMSRHDITNTRSASGDDGVHASDIRRWCIDGDFENVRDAMPKELSDADVHKLMGQVKAGLK